MHDSPVRRSQVLGLGGGMGRVDLAGAAHLELVSGVVQLHPQDVMVDAMLSGWRAQQMARGLRECTIVPRERLLRPVPSVSREDPSAWETAPVGESDPTLTVRESPAASSI